jgi:tryptophanyl-tRNA synthetase
MVDAQGQLLLQSKGFASPKEAAQTIALLKTEGINCLEQLISHVEPLSQHMQALLAESLKILETANEKFIK